MVYLELKMKVFFYRTYIFLNLPRSCFLWCLGDDVGLLIYRSGVNLDPALVRVLVVSISSASRELMQGTVGIDCFLRGKLPGRDMLSLEPLFLLGLK